MTTIDQHYNLLRKVDLSPLRICRGLRMIHIYENPLRTLDATPLLSCPDLMYLDEDHGVACHVDERAIRVHPARGMPLSAAVKKMLSKVETSIAEWKT